MRKTTVYRMLDLSYSADCKGIQRQLKEVRLQQEKDILALKRELDAIGISRCKWMFL